MIQSILRLLFLFIIKQEFLKITEHDNDYKR